MAKLRVLVALTRPAVVILFALVVAIGVAQGGRPSDAATTLAALVPAVAFLVFAVALNDLGDTEIDRVNLAGHRERPLASGIGGRTDMVIVAATAAAVAIIGAALMGPVAATVMALGLAFAVAYSVPPVRLTARGGLAPLTLPLAFVAVPYTLGVLAARGHLVMADVALATGLYVAFIGRLVLKDFRDVRGDVLFGKRTFLIRRGRRAACVAAGACWSTGTLVVAAATAPTPAAAAMMGACLATTLVLFALLARSTSPRRDETLIAAAAVIGRITLIVVLTHQTTTARDWTALGEAAVLGLLALTTILTIHHMLRTGPTTTTRVPPELIAEAARPPHPASGAGVRAPLASRGGE